MKLDVLKLKLVIVIKRLKKRLPKKIINIKSRMIKKQSSG